MPENHRQYTQWNAERFIKWASGVGSHTEQAIKAIIASRKVEQQSYKTCIALLKLADIYSALRLEEACKKALYYHANPSFRSIKTILKTGSDKFAREISSEILARSKRDMQQYAFTRGKSYYGGKNDDK
jgi:hypothetical protein